MNQLREDSFEPHIILFLFLNWFDTLFTSYIIIHGGIEVMPIAAYIIANFGLIGLVVFKVLMCMSVILFLQTFNIIRLLVYINICMLIICLVGLISISFII